MLAMGPPAVDKHLTGYLQRSQKKKKKKTLAISNPAIPITLISVHYGSSIRMSDTASNESKLCFVI